MPNRDQIMKTLVCNQMEERVLRLLDDMDSDGDLDAAHIDIAREKIEQAFMHLERAIVPKDRIDLPEDEFH